MTNLTKKELNMLHLLMVAAYTHMPELKMNSEYFELDAKIAAMIKEHCDHDFKEDFVRNVYTDEIRQYCYKCEKWITTFGTIY